MHSYRLITLFDIPKFRLGFKHIHHALMRDGRLVLYPEMEGILARSMDENLSRLIESAVRKEWLQSLNAHSHLLKEGGDYDRDGSLFRQLGDNGPWHLPDIKDLDTILQKLPVEFHSFLREVASDARKIVHRRTVFLVPDYQPYINNEPPKLSELLLAIGREMAKMSSSSQSIPYGFLRLQSQVKHPSSSQGLMTQLIRNMMVWTSSLLIEQSRRYAREGALLMDGPTGVGKSLAAELIALQQKKSLVKVNIAAINDELLEGRMRGYCRGAFTGAVKNHDGWFAQADGGILFLDEFQNASLASQTQLLDLLDPVSNNVMVSRIGDDVVRKYRVKVILAVNKPIHELLIAGRIREDLFYRIRDVVKLHSFNDLIKSSNEGEGFSKIFGWIQTYRWKSAPYLGVGKDDQFTQEDDCISLFPELSRDIIPVIREFDWKGNFRQFERVLTNVLWNNDDQRQAILDAGSLLKELESERLRLGEDSLVIRVEEVKDEVLRKRIELVEKILERNQFVITKSLSELKEHDIGMGSRQSLRTFLKTNFESLSSRIRQQAILLKFIKI